MSSLLYAQQIIYKIGGTLSCLGSGYIIQDVFRNTPRGEKNVYQRIMVGLSIMDIFSSFFGFVLGSWPMPKDTDYIWAIGNWASCDVAAFIGITGYFGSPLYNCSLASFYSLRLKYLWPNSRIRKVEKWFHIVPWLLPIICSIITLCTKTMGPSVVAGFCGTSATTPYPFGCSEPGSEVECIRGGQMMNYIVFIVPILGILICIIYVAVVMFRVYKKVRSTELVAEKYSFTARFGGIQKKKSRKMSRRIMIHGVLYAAAMILTWIVIFIYLIIYSITKNKDFSFMISVVNPLQGVFNFLIYLTPVFRKMLKKRRQQQPGGVLHGSTATNQLELNKIFDEEEEMEAKEDQNNKEDDIDDYDYNHEFS